MIIRKATREDQEQLHKLLKEFENSYEDTLSGKHIQIRAYKDLEKAITDTIEKYLSKSECIFLVADEKGSLKGFIAGEVKEKKYRVYNKEGYVDKWFVEESCREKRVGRKLFDKILEEFKKAGCTHVGVATHLDNIKAIQIYEHMGFTKKLITFFKPLQELS